MDIVVTFKASPADFDLIRDALRFYVDARRENAEDRLFHPNYRRQARADALKGEELLRSMGKLF